MANGVNSGMIQTVGRFDYNFAFAKDPSISGRISYSSTKNNSSENFGVIVGDVKFYSYFNLTSINMCAGRERGEERSAKLFMRPNCVMIVYGVEYFRARCFLSPSRGRESNACEQNASLLSCHDG